MRTKLLIVGFDAMDYLIAKRTIGNYHFKNFNPILKKQVTKEYWTDPSWASFYTGLSKNIHGVIDGWGQDKKGPILFTISKIMFLAYIWG